jgi:hypothetical protein
LDPDEAIHFRTTNCKNIGGKIGDTVGPRILAELERLLRENPLGKTFATTGQMIAKIKDAENVPKFQVNNSKYFIVAIRFFPFIGGACDRSRHKCRSVESKG